jgi:hypothetical protein
MNNTGNNDERFSIIIVASGRNSLDKFYCTKNYVLEDEYTFVRKNIHLLCLMYCFKHNKICKWKRFIWRKEFVMDNPVYVVYKQVSAAFFSILTLPQILVSETLVSSIRDSAFFCRFYWNIQFCLPTSMFLYRIRISELTFLYYFVILPSRASVINGHLQGELSCTIIQFNIILRIRS